MSPISLSITPEKVDNRYFVAYENKNRNKSFPQHVIEHFESTKGDFRIYQLFERISRLCSLVLKEMGNANAYFFDALASQLSTTGAFLGLRRLAPVTERAYEILSSNAGSLLDRKRDLVQKTHDVAEATAAWGYAASLLSKDPIYRNTGGTFDLIANITDAGMIVQDFRLAGKHLKMTPDNHVALRQRFSDTRKGTFIKGIKTIASIASGAFGLLGLTFGGPVRTQSVFLALGLVSTLAALGAHFFTVRSPYEEINFFKPKYMCSNQIPAH